MKNKLKYKSLNNMRGNALVLVRYLFPFDLAVRGNLSQYNNIVLLGIYSKNRWQGTQRQEQASPTWS